jgi:hypothetical protein
MAFSLKCNPLNPPFYCLCSFLEAHRGFGKELSSKLQREAHSLFQYNTLSHTKPHFAKAASSARSSASQSSCSTALPSLFLEQSKPFDIF